MKLGLWKNITLEFSSSFKMRVNLNNGENGRDANLLTYHFRRLQNLIKDAIFDIKYEISKLFLCFKMFNDFNCERPKITMNGNRSKFGYR